MSEPGYILTFDGQETQKKDIATMGINAGLADDRVLAELLHIPPFLSSGSVISKRVIPYTQSAFPSGLLPAGQYTGVVQPSGANGAVNIFPFRVIIGSRNPVSAIPVDNGAFPNPANSTAALANWRDVRSGIFVGSSTSLSTTNVLAANASGDPRWDLVYATIQVDSSTVVSDIRRVKSSSNGVIANVSVPSYLSSPVGVAVVTGTPGSLPAFPSLPADTTGQYNVALAFVRVPATFGGTSTVAPKDIRATISQSTGASTSEDYVDLSSRMHSSPCNGNNDANTSGAAGANAFNVYAGSQYYQPSFGGQRPSAFLPPDWVGGFSKFLFVDTISTNPSHVNGGLVDNSCDWRGRIFRVDAQASGLSLCTGSTVSVPSIPAPYNLTGGPTVSNNIRQLSNSIGIDGSIVSGMSTVFFATHTDLPLMSVAATVGLYVNPTTGVLYWFANGTVANAQFVIWIDGSGILANR